MTWMLLQTWFPDDLWTQNLEQSIVRGDPTSNVLYFAVLILCAPIWEEVRVPFSHQWCKLVKMLNSSVSILLQTARQRPIHSHMHSHTCGPKSLLVFLPRSQACGICDAGDVQRFYAAIPQ